MARSSLVLSPSSLSCRVQASRKSPPPPPGLCHQPIPRHLAPRHRSRSCRGNPALARATLSRAVEIIGFDFLLNQFDRHFIDANEYGSNFTTFRHNLTQEWVVDNDPFATNQFLHPYQGSMYHGFARSAGLNYWESLGYAFAGSVLWETAGETTPPSINDQIASGIGGTFLGEPLFRMASLLLEEGGQVPRFWRELGAGGRARTWNFVMVTSRS